MLVYGSLIIVERYNEVEIVLDALVFVIIETFFYWLLSQLLNILTAGTTELGRRFDKLMLILFFYLFIIFECFMN